MEKQTISIDEAIDQAFADLGKMSFDEVLNVLGSLSGLDRAAAHIGREAIKARLVFWLDLGKLDEAQACWTRNYLAIAKTIRTAAL